MLVPLTCVFRNCPLKEEFLEIWLTTFFGLRNFGNTSARTVIFLWKCLKFNLAFKIEETNWENVFCFWDYCIWTGGVELSLLRREYLSSTGNILTNILKTLHITREIFSNWINLTVINKYGKGRVVQISTVFRPPYMLRLFRDLMNNVFRSP